jgi:hypothetical protein
VAPGHWSACHFSSASTPTSPSVIVKHRSRS